MKFERIDEDASSLRDGSGNSDRRWRSSLHSLSYWSILTKFSVQWRSLLSNCGVPKHNSSRDARSSSAIRRLSCTEWNSSNSDRVSSGRGLGTWCLVGSDSCRNFIAHLRHTNYSNC